MLYWLLCYATTETENDTINLVKTFSRIFNVAKSTQIEVFCMRLSPCISRIYTDTMKIISEPKDFFLILFESDTVKHNEKQQENTNMLYIYIPYWKGN